MTLQQNKARKAYERVLHTTKASAAGDLDNSKEVPETSEDADSIELLLPKTQSAYDLDVKSKEAEQARETSLFQEVRTGKLTHYNRSYFELLGCREKLK